MGTKSSSFSPETDADPSNSSSSPLPSRNIGKDRYRPPSQTLGQRTNDVEIASLQKSKLRCHFLIRIIEHHYRETPHQQKTEAEILSESLLLPGCPWIKVKFNRWLIIPFAIVIQFCCGALYAWSVLNAPIDAWINPDDPTANKAPLTFSIAIGTFGLSAAILGPWIERHGPRTSTLVGSSLYVSGFFISALALHLRLMWLLYLGYGVVGSVGASGCYLSAVAILQKWFPDRRGMASGLAVVGCGAGAMVAGQILLPLSQTIGLPLTFVALGAGVMGPLLISGWLYRTPPPNFMLGSDSEIKTNPGQGQSQPDQPQFSPIAALTSLNFGLLYITFFANSLSGLVAMSRLANMTRDIFGRSEDEGALVVSINGLFDLGGRLGFSLLSDWLGRKNSFLVILTTQLLLLSTLTAVTTSKTYWAFLLSVWILTGCYGAGLGILAAFLSDSFGPRNVGTTQGVIFTAWSLAGVGGGLVFTAVFDSVKDDLDNPCPYSANFLWILATVGVGWIGLLFVTPTKKDKDFMGRARDVFKKVTICAPFNINTIDSYEMNRKGEN